MEAANAADLKFAPHQFSLQEYLQEKDKKSSALTNGCHKPPITSLHH